MAKSPNWTKDEIDILVNNYPELGSGPEIIKLLPGRTSKGVNVKASRMGLKISFCRKWQEEEIDILKDNYPTYGSSIRMQELLPNRTIEAIKIQAARLGINSETLYGKMKPLEVYLEELSIAGFTLLGTYTTSKNKALHRCNKCYHEWMALPGNIVCGSGCPNCARKLPFSYEIGNIYLLRITTSTNTFLKIGITSRNTVRRIEEISRELVIPISNIEILITKEGPGTGIFALERDVLTNKELVRYTHTDKFSGCTELFSTSETQKIIDIINDKNFS